MRVRFFEKMNEIFAPWIAPHDPYAQDLSRRMADPIWGANGAWDQRTAIPADRSRFGVFDGLGELSNARSRKVIETAAATANAS